MLACLSPLLLGLASKPVRRPAPALLVDRKKTWSNPQGSVLTQMCDDLYLAERPFFPRLPGLQGTDVGCKAVVVKLNDGTLWVHAPVGLDAPLRSALADLGPFLTATPVRRVGSVMSDIHTVMFDSEWDIASDRADIGAGFYAVTEMQYDASRRQELLDYFTSRIQTLAAIHGLLFVRSVDVEEGLLMIVGGYSDQAAAIAAAPVVNVELAGLGPFATAAPVRVTGPTIWWPRPLSGFYAITNLEYPAGTVSDMLAYIISQEAVIADIPGVLSASLF